MKRINPALVMMAAVGSILSHGIGYKYVKVDPPKKFRQRKNKGGSFRNSAKRINSPHYKAWKKVFGGLAVPAYQG